MKGSKWCLTVTIILSGTLLRAQHVTPDDEDYDMDDPVQVVAHRASAERQRRLIKNSKQLTYQLSVDRDTPYFPGEAVKVEIRITNPTSSPLEIPDPNNPAIQCFTGNYEGGCRIPLKVPSTNIQPGEMITLTVDSADKETAERWEFNGASTSPGKERLAYLLGGSVEFEIGPPVVESSAVVPLQEFSSHQDRGMERPETIEAAALVVATHLGSDHVVLISRNNTLATRKIETDKDGLLPPRVVSWGAPWIRVATSPSTVTDLKATADPKGRVTVHYTAAGVEQNLYLNEQRRPGK